MLIQMTCMMLWTGVCGITAFVGRVRAIRTRQIKTDDFKVLNLDDAPPFVQRGTKHIANLFEFPVLFYGLCLAIEMKSFVDPLFTGLAWVYFLLRVGHSIVHLGPNIVSLRAALFLISNVCLIVMAIRLLIRLTG